LQRHTVRLVEHHPRWAALFLAASAELQRLVGDLVVDIQHIGSTSVPGLPAKPILDIDVALHSRDDLPAIITALTHHDYIDRGDGGTNGGYLLVRDIQPDVRAIHLHLMESTDKQWRDDLAFRDALRGDAVLRERYAALKRDLVRQFPDDRKSYTAGKHEFIQRTLKGTHHDQGGDC
ncbi:MAG TPA: GrpB family protein, partial [Armatimonadota bacterium]|nr:GrpB family protein [Armatimonadota bacterium]